MVNTLNFDHLTAKRFERAYKKAILKQLDQFTFDGNVFLTAFARYVIEYLKNKKIL